jgi:outer membrane biosynthesis protein TonB
VTSSSGSGTVPTPTPTPTPGATPAPGPTPTPTPGPGPGPTPTPSATPSPSPGTNPCVADTTGPTVAIDAPAQNAILNTAPVAVRASASDANGIVSIEIFARRPITGTVMSLGLGTSSPFQVNWNPECNSPLWTLFAQARDACNNVSTSANRTVIVAVPNLALCL